jgi:hypothetical protein
MPRAGIVTLSNDERARVATPELSGNRNCRGARVHRRGSEASVRSSRCEVALDVEGIVDGSVG